MENLIYLNEDAVNEELINHHGAELRQTIESINRNVGIGGEVGAEAGDPSGLFARLKGAISGSYERGREEEFIYDLTDEVAKFALLMEVLDTSNAIEVDGGFGIEERSNLSTDSPVLITAPLIRIPVGELKEKFDQDDTLSGFSEGISKIAESGMLGPKEIDEAKDLQEEIESVGCATRGLKTILSSIANNDFYRTNSRSDVDFVTELEEGHFRTRPLDFPSSTKPYALIAKIITKVDKIAKYP